MHSHSSLNGYDSRPTGLALNSNDVQRINDRSLWHGDSKALPIYATDDSTWPNEKFTPQNMGSRARAALSHTKRLVLRYWPSASRRRSPRPLMMSTKSSMTTPTTVPALSNVVFILLCGLWYTTSALSSNTGKAILTQFRYPVTLTFIQFGFVAVYCMLFMSPVVRFSRMRMPTKAIIRSTLPMGMFQVGGHMFSSMAISRIPVSTVHTIKALSPLFTVAAYAILFKVSYSAKTYISLLPLTLGVMLACSFDMSASDMIGLLCAFGSAVVFVSSNIFFKKIMPSSTGGGMSQPSSHKLDKLNLLFYSSGMAFLLMIPIWLYCDLPAFLAATPDHVTHPNHGHATPHSVPYYLLMNGTVHFAQNIIAFVILSSTSPVTYSIASLIKRVVVICIAIVWFSQTVHPIQAFGITMTFIGLYMYNNAKSDVERGENKMRRVEAARDLMLPTTKADTRLMMNGTPPPEIVPGQSQVIGETTGMGLTSAAPYGRGRTNTAPVSISHSHSQSHHHPHPHNQSPTAVLSPPSLSLKIVPSISSGTSVKPISPLALKEMEFNATRPVISPTDSYPSPPPSLDSPPSETVPLGYAAHGGQLQARLVDIHDEKSRTDHRP